MVWKQSVDNILIIGHRGVKALYPENTMLSFQKAIEMGVDGIETDINMTADGQLIIMHDNNLDRTTSGCGKISDFTLAEIKKLSAGSFFSAEYQNEKVPTLDEFIDLVKDKSLLLNIEIKDYRREVVDKTIKALDGAGLTDTYVIASFCPEMTTYAFKQYGVKTQGFPLSYLSGWDEETERCYYSVGIEMGDLTPAICDEYRTKGIDPWCWCPDNEAGVKKAIECRSTLMTCNDPRAALKILRTKSDR